jgi:hypothetical protein
MAGYAKSKDRINQETVLASRFSGKTNALLPTTGNRILLGMEGKERKN